MLVNIQHTLFWWNVQFNILNIVSSFIVIVMLNPSEEIKVLNY